MRAIQGLVDGLSLFGFLRGERAGYLHCPTVSDTYCETPALEFAMLVEVTEAVTKYVHVGCT